MDKKKWYKSKTIWINLIGLVALVSQTQTGFVIDAEAQVGILAVVNLVLRMITGAALKG